jgi:benzoyl-CoA reductase/2-hydroxyglutaryl-CoA dehydratase subunit BcrC/BadD/HgdB
MDGLTAHVEEWKERGGKVIGFTCSYMPEEILFAGQGSARVLPYRMSAQGCEQTDDADVFLHKFCCGYAKCLLQLGLAGDYGFLDGIVWTSCCEQLRRTFEYWRDEVRFPFARMFAVPHAMEGENRMAWFRTETVDLLAAVDEHVGRRTTPDDLRDAIRIYNEHRKLVMQLYELRALDRPKLTGSEAMRVLLSGFALPKDVHNARLHALLAELRARPGLDRSGARIMLCGSYLDDTYLIDLIEEAGAVVVTDSLCTGRRYVEELVDETIDPIEALARRYFRRVSCPRMIGDHPRRLDFTRRLAREAKVDGIVFQRLPFCDNHAVENLMEANALAAEGIPTLQLEREYLAGDKGRLKTRVQAFMEKIAT